MARPKAPQRKPAIRLRGRTGEWAEGKRLLEWRLALGTRGMGCWRRPDCPNAFPALSRPAPFPWAGVGDGSPPRWGGRVAETARGQAAVGPSRRARAQWAVCVGGGAFSAARVPGTGLQSLPSPLPPGNRIWRPPFSRLLPRCDFCVPHFSGLTVRSLLLPRRTGSLFFFVFGPVSSRFEVDFGDFELGF